MRHTLDASEPARYVLLGLLLDGPRHGYDLARHFAPQTALGTVLHLSQSHLYALLTRLERDGLLRGERPEAGMRPPRHVYYATAAGRAAVDQWIDQPVAQPRDALLDFPLKVYLARRLSLVRAAALVAQQQTRFTTSSILRRGPCSHSETTTRRSSRWSATDVSPAHVPR